MPPVLYEPATRDPDALWTSPEQITAIRAAYAAELASPKKALTYEDIPLTYEDITAEWLTATIGESVPGAAVTTFELGPPDDGTANRRRITMEWNAAGQAASLPASVFCKATQSLNNRLNLAWGGLASEVNFFNFLRNMVDIEAPTAVHAALDPTSFNSIIVLHDLTGKVDFCSVDTPVTKEMMEDQMEILAKLHGRFYESKEKEVQAIVTWRQGFLGYCATVDVEDACANGWAAAEEVIPPKLFARGPEVWAATLKSTYRQKEMPETIVHSDVHLGNWYKTKAGKMGLQDYQTMGRGPWARDLAYLLGTSPSPENRRAWEKDLVRHYLAAFEKAGGPKTTEEAAWYDIKDQLLTALSGWTLTLRPSKDMPSNMQTPTTSLKFIGRFAAMIDDHNVMDMYLE